MKEKITSLHMETATIQIVDNGVTASLSIDTSQGKRIYTVTNSDMLEFLIDSVHLLVGGGK